MQYIPNRKRRDMAFVWLLLWLVMMTGRPLPAFGQGGSGSAGDTLPTYALTVNAFQGGSADAALIMLDFEVWRPRISADLGSWGAAGTHTFRVKSGRSLPQTLAILPVEAILPDDGRVSLWWSLWSDDPVLIDGVQHRSSAPLSEGNDDIADTTHLISVKPPTLTLESVTFSGMPGDIVTDAGEPYPVPHWQTGRDTTSPVAYVRQDEMTVTVNFAVDANTGAGPVYVKGVGSNGVTFAPNIANLFGDRATATLTSSPLPNAIALWDPLTITWYYSPTDSDAGPWLDAGISRNPVYVLLGAPQTAPLYHTLVHLGCENAKGETTPEGAIPKIWGEFTDQRVVRVKTSAPMQYYGPRTSQNPDPLPRDFFTTEGLLKFGDGRCEAWANFFVDTLRIQGIDTAFTRVIFPKNNLPNIAPFGFLVKHWEITYSPRHAQDLPGIAGQGNENPKSAFANHVVVSLRGCFKSSVVAKRQGVSNLDLT